MPLNKRPKSPLPLQFWRMWKPVGYGRGSKKSLDEKRAGSRWKQSDRRERASLGGSVCPKCCCSVRVVHGLHLVALDMHCNSGLKSPKGIWYFKYNLQLLLGLLKDNFTFDAGFSLTAQTSSILSPSFKSRLCSSILSRRFESDFYQTTSSSIFIVAIIHHVTALKFSMTQILADSVTVSKTIPVT